MENMTSPGTLLSGDNATWLEEYYQTWLRAPEQLPEDWRRFFLSPELTVQSVSGDNNVSGTTLKKQAAVIQLINAWRTQGHLRAKLDPLGLNPPADVPSLQPGFWGLSEEDLLQEFSVTFGAHTTQMPLKQLLNLLEQAWAGSQAYELAHLENREEINWLLSRIESSNAPQADAQTCIARFEKLMAAETLERYLHTRYVGQKRFSLEGGESAIPALDTLTKRLRAQGVEEMVIGMAHRGRLNVLVNLLNKDPAQLFAEFEGKQTIGSGSGDVKYHMGYSSNLETPAGSLHVALAYNPSHLEIVNPVVLGQVRARQERRGEDGQAKVVGVLIHGDSALGGLGVNQTTFNLSQTQGYGTGGTLHLVINNQIGFTTSRLQDMRSSRYCTDIAKMVAAPIIHVNGDDVDAVCQVMELACEWRDTFRRDIIIDICCFRKHGHNESDEPRLTQPQMYQAVDVHPGTLARYGESLARRGLLTQAQQDEMTARYRDWLDSCQKREPQPLKPAIHSFSANWYGLTNPHWSAPVSTALPRQKLVAYGEIISTLPPDVVAHPTIKRQLALRQDMAAGTQPVDWGMAEMLAYASLVDAGVGVRLSGEDSGRGTFSHRHAVVHHQTEARRYLPLQHIRAGQASFDVYDSVLNEEALLAFEYGYSTSAPQQLVIWEAQFGDFANGAQVAIDQFISSGETKWDRYSGLTILLPHGYDGQGPEHSSARPERWLQLCAENNMQVVMPSESAQMFHLLRGQALRPMRKPLVIMMSKRLLRFKGAMSELCEFTDGAYKPVITDPQLHQSQKVKRVILCSGQVYYDVLEARKQREHEDEVAIVRLEQLYPFPVAELNDVLASWPNCCEWIWLQEEPENQGAWRQIRHELAALKINTPYWQYAGRPAAAAPATGYGRVHKQQIDEFLAAAFADIQP
ncbi:2-oxoglutarate dehydrogenase E1 component [Escherichia coli]|uniref:2-oxoglutarate dehydrogenase E1 component n=1 Tax=Escherichia coli TaxID=562 RepID=UPI0001E8A190|nr:2-oxoglutarate dehydrogenase E1 component [Escherichia coli]EEZ5961121.1 2-oxoglutarate dehydrogenase E1 component [Escherichia coli O19]EGI23702.1 oxoglutarate dehydrogenase (succinyl-transferring), E1 component [Escherichia coli TA206]MBE8544010.1 2-oxoglutarate dehydrogenase E1 component [Escherichia coli]MBE8562264.1 2-oxoglutarate dehydrogenase E1 component [Escherichia coli]MED0213184.1 2-oxoglutarate dehydrogenase E1 component [Escherichia coli]